MEKMGLWAAKMEKLGDMTVILNDLHQSAAKMDKLLSSGENITNGISSSKSEDFSRGRWQIDISYSLDSERSAASDTAETKKWFCTRHHGNKISKFGSPKHQMNSIKSY